MSYLALARKWRPRSFSQLVGQEHINKAIIKSLDQQRLHHAYLFTGTRGVGKTSIARLMAKALNCEQGVSANPCLNCDACISIEQGRFIDLIEIDAASKTRVEDTRELLENVPYAATQGRFKIYLIDEVHMLSQHSFNALLKTLEEPPAHVKFLLATTDPQKLPVTILSRCLQFNLYHLSVEVISKQLAFILQEEQYPFELEALNLLAKAAQGSMRDALSLLDQAIASTNHSLSAAEVKSILGYTQQDYALELLQALAKEDAAQLITISRKIALEGGYFSYVLDELLAYLHQISVQQVLTSHPLLETLPQVQALAQECKAEDIQLFYQIGIKGSQDMHLAPTLAIGFEMTLLRMFAFKPASPIPPPRLASEETKPTPTPEALPTMASSDSKAKDQSTETWETIVPQLNLSGLSLNAAENSVWVKKEDKLITLAIAKGHQSLFTPQVTKKLEQALSQFYNEPTKLALLVHEQLQNSPAQLKAQTLSSSKQEAELNLQQDPFFQQLRQEFSAELIKNSITLAKDPL